MTVHSPSHPDASPQLVWSEDGSPRSGRFGDVYFSVDDGLAESRAVFLEGCAMPRAWAGRSHFTVVELGFGTGLNIVALLDLWQRERSPGAHLSIVTVERFPVTSAQARRALAAWPEVEPVAAALLDAWPPGTPGFHRVDLSMFHATLDLLVGDAATMLETWSGRADAWFLDGFSPALNPEMWSDAVLDAIAARSAVDARLATFTVAGVVRRGLTKRGFQVDKRPGHGRKRERLEARLGTLVDPVLTVPRVAVIGAGIAGASVCRALTTSLAGKVILIEASGPGSGASGFPAALVTPRLDAGDTLIAALYAQALERAGDLYRAVPDAVTDHGVMQLASAARDAGRFAKIAGQSFWPDGDMVVLDPAAASEAAGEPVDQPALRMAAALAIRPHPIIKAWLGGVTVVAGEAARLERAPDGWRIMDAAGDVMAEVDHVVVASGVSAARLLPGLSLSPVRGQAEWVENAQGPAIAWGGYIVPTGDGVLYGATHDRGESGDETRAGDRARNLATVRARLPVLADRLATGLTRSRAAVRATTPDRLPLCGPVAGMAGIWILSGLGSRGFCAAPLLGEHLAATILGRPSPLPVALATRVRPDRFASALPDGASG